MIPYSSVIIGEGTLPRVCATILNEAGIKVSGIISNDVDFQQWADEHQIPWHPANVPNAELIHLLSAQPFDFLFSIINYRILSPELLALPRRGAINYHDAPLPRYAGTYAAAWAIMEQQHEHGISWHMMSDVTDAGDILNQARFPIDADETTLTLNAKCYMAAVEGFRAVAQQIATDTLEPQPQNLAKRSYYDYYKRPAAASVIDWHKPASEIGSLIRGLYHGTYPNPIAAPKTVIDGELFLPLVATTTVRPSTQPPGTIVANNNGQLTVATADVDIELSDLVDAVGEKRVPTHPSLVGSAPTPAQKLAVGTCLYSPTPNEQADLSAYQAKVVRRESYWRKRLQKVIPVVHPYEKGTVGSTAGSKENDGTHLGYRSLARTGFEHITQFSSSSISPASGWLSLIGTYLHRVAGSAQFDIELHHAGLADNPNPAIFAATVPFHFQFDQAAEDAPLSFATMAKAVGKQLASVAAKDTFAHDIFSRYPDLLAHRQRDDFRNTGVAICLYGSNEAHPPAVQAPLAFYIDEREPSRLEIRFDLTQFEQAYVELIADQLAELLQSVSQQPQVAISTLSLLSPAEQQKLIHTWNRPTISVETGGAAGTCLHERFEEQAHRHPTRIAVSYEEEHLSYAALNQQANLIAHKLQAIGVGPNVLVGLCVDRSLDIVRGILAILKSGGAYVPIDPTSPAERTAFIVQDASMTVLLTQRKQADTLPSDHSAQVLYIEDLLEERVEPASQGAPVTAVSATDTAYVIYTSGSTGKPKGCLVTHQNAVRLMDATNGWYHFDEEDVWTLFHSFAFDFSVWEIWGALFYGGRIVTVPYMVSRSPDAFLQLIVDEGVTVLNQTPSAFRQLVQTDVDSAMPVDAFALRYVIFGGEALELPTLRPWFQRHGDQRPQLVNMYGITETTVHVTYRPINQKDVDENRGSVIGVPIPDLQVYVLDAALQPVPIGIPGEIYVGGAGVANGYLNRPALTAERFIESPFIRGTRLYKSGDVARLLPNRDLEYIGRSDTQVKIRGFRIELGEIESVVRNHPNVRDNAVIALTTESGSKQLVSYFIATDKEKPPATAELRDFVGAQVPPYMIPAFFVPLAAFPLTTNGKLDQGALPKPELAVAERKASYVAPRNPVEQTLAEIWEAVLRLPQIGTHDNFFELGGDSILSIQIISKAREVGLLLTPYQLFQYTTIAELAAVAEVAPQQQREQGLVVGDAVLTPIQHWFFEQDIPDKDQWNQSFFVEVAHPLDEALLEKAIHALQLHHDMLRTRFEPSDLGWRQTIMDEVADGAFVQWVDLRAVNAAEQQVKLREYASDAQRQLDLARGKLLHAVYFQLGDSQPDRLLIAIHHLVVDGVSWRILFQDLSRIYTALGAGNASPLVAKSSSFKAWGDALVDYTERAFAKGGTDPQEVAHWRQVLNQPRTILPVDQSSGENIESSADELLSRFDVATTEMLLRDAPAAYNTQINDLLLTALTLAHHRWTGSTALLMELEGHGREAVTINNGVDLSDTVGWFTTVFPLHLDLSTAQAGGDVDLGSALMQIKETLRAVPNKGIGYGLLRYLDAENLPVPADFRPDIVFNYLGQLDQLTADAELFNLVGESVGDVHSPTSTRRHLLEIMGQVVNGALEIRWLYSQNRHNRDTIERFASYFEEALQAIVQHCVAQEASRTTPSDYPLANLTQKSLDTYWQSAQAAGLAIQDIYQLAPMQQLFYAMDRGNPEVGFEQWHFKMSGRLNKDALQAAWQEVIQRHSILRTAFFSEGLAQPHQFVYQQVGLPWQEFDYRDLTPQEQTQRLLHLLVIDKQQPFDLTDPRLNRLILVRMDEQIYHLIWSTHHLEIDGWSWPLVFKDLSTLYGSIVGGNVDPLPPAPQYRAYLNWLQLQKPTESADFWRANLAGVKEPTPLAGMMNKAKARGAGQQQSIEPIEVTATLEPAIFEKLVTVAQQNHVTMGLLFQAAWALLLCSMSGDSDIVWGTTFAGRPTDLPAAGDIVGPFVNNLPVRAQVEQDASLGEWLNHLQQNQLALTQFQHTPLVQIQQWSDVPIRHRIFNSLVVFQNYTIDESARRLAGNVTLETLADPQTTNYPITVVGMPSESLAIKVICRAEYFEPDVATAILSDLQALLGRIVEQPDGQLGDYLSNASRWASYESSSTPDTRVMDRVVGENGQFATRGTTRPMASSLATSSVEGVVADVWRQLFDRKQIGRYDNFFDLGGHSLMIAAMHEEIEKRLDRSFPITQAFQYPTIQSLAASLGQDNAAITSDYGSVRTRAERAKAAKQQRRQKRR